MQRQAHQPTGLSVGRVPPGRTEAASHALTSPHIGVDQAAFQGSCYATAPAPTWCVRFGLVVTRLCRRVLSCPGGIPANWRRPLKLTHAKCPARPSRCTHRGCNYPAAPVHFGRPPMPFSRTSSYRLQASSPWHHAPCSMLHAHAAAFRTVGARKRLPISPAFGQRRLGAVFKLQARRSLFRSGR